jgi:serine/threonine protein kinase
MASELTPVPDDLDFGVTIKGLVVSQQVFGRYTLRHVLGRGGMGVVWLAHDERLERDVALKFLPEAVHFDAGALDDLKRETRRCLDLTHPNIIRIYDFVTDQQAAAISMEYIDGKTMAGLRIEKENRVFEVADLSDWMAQVCQALFYAHEEVKVVHRDLKPANLMLTSRGQIKIADFGIARSVSDSMTQVTMRRATSGTLVYMSPQQMNGDMSRVTDDIYALGATMYEFLTSKPPFYSGDIPFQVRQSIPRKLSERREELGISGDEIPQEWEDAIAACLEKVPEQRPASMLALAERLGLSVGAMTRSSTQTATKASTAREAKPAPKLPKAPKPPRKPFPTKLAAIAGGGLVAVGLLGWLIWAFILWPFIATPGELSVSSNPSGATVHISGQDDQVTPADFPKLRIGRYHVTITTAGYDPAEETVTITEGGKAALTNIALKRTFGKLKLTTVPSHARYSLTGTGPAADTSKEGTTPDFLPNLPAGTYQLTVTASAIPSHTETIEVPARDTLTENIDLVKLEVSADGSPDPVKVFLGQMDAGQLDAKGKSELGDLFHSAFEKYLSYGMLAAAADLVAKMKTLGQDTTAQEKELADKRTSTEKEVASKITDLISDKNFAAAQAELQSLDGVLEKESIDRLNAQFQQPLAQYQQQIDSAIAQSQNGAPADGYAQLKTFAASYPNDLKLQLALAQLETRMPPDHDRLTAQLKTFKQIATTNKEAVANADFQAMQDKFTTELQQFDALTKALADAKNGPGNLKTKIANLQSEEASDEKKKVGYDNANAMTQTANFLSKNLIGRQVVPDAFYSSEQDKKEQIDELDKDISTDQTILAQSQGSVTQAQQAYDQFIAQVPW